MVIKTINVSEETWKNLMSDKILLGHKTIDDVIISYRKIVKKVERANQETKPKKVQFTK